MVAAISKRPFRPFLLLFILLLAFALRLHNLDAFSFWTDEGLTPLRSSYSIPEILSNRVTIQEGITKDTHPPLYYLLIHFTRPLFGETDFAYRYPSLLLGVLLVPLMFQFGRVISYQLSVISYQSSVKNTAHCSLITDYWSLMTGIVAALLTAVNPLQIWYANEARMYTLFVLLVAVMSYILWQTISNLQSPHLFRPLALYALFAGLAVYTHYAAVFLIAAQGLFWVWLLWQKGQKKLILGTAVAGVLLAIPLIPFTLPRLFTGAEAGYAYVSPWIMLQDVVHFFSLGLTTDFAQPVIRLLDAGYLLLAIVGLYAVRSGIGRSFLLAYLLATVFGLMAGSLLKPMYQGVRHIMVDSPAWLLLLALGSGQGGKGARGQVGKSASRQGGKGARDKGQAQQMMSERRGARGEERRGRGEERWARSEEGNLLSTFALHPSPFIPPPSPFAFLVLGLALIGPVIALNNLYTNPIYAKDDFRALVRYVEQQAGEQDVIVYNNAILLPLHEHYRLRPDIAVTALPVYPHSAVPDDPQLAQLVQTYERIWYVTDVPADYRDDDQLIRAWLAEHLTVVDAQSFHARTVVVAVVAYATQPRELEILSENGRSLSLQWPNLPALQGIQLANSQPVRLPTLWFDLFWQNGPAPAPETSLRFILRGADGKNWAVFDQPVGQAWPETAESLIRQSYYFPLPLGMPPGRYTLLAQAADGEAQSLTEVELAGTDQWPVPPGDLYRQVRFGDQPFMQSLFWENSAVLFKNGLTLRGIEFPAFAVRPGHNLPFTLYWQTQQPLPTGVTYQLEVVAPDGSVLKTQGGMPGATWLTNWPPGALIREDTALYFSPETQPGRYYLRWRLLNGEETVSGRPSWQPWPQETVYFGYIEVEPWPIETTLPDNAAVVKADFGSAIQLYGYQVEQADTLNLTLYWQVTNKPEGFYVVFIHLVSADGTIVAQKDQVPVEGVRPTSGWRAGEVLTDHYTFQLPPDLPPGGYDIRVGLYNPDDQLRLPVMVNNQPQPDNQLVLTTVTLGQ